MGKPKILVLGHGQHGKDTVGDILAYRLGFRFLSSSLFAAEKLILPHFESIGQPYASLEACYADRVNHRALWYDLISAYNTPEKDSLCREIVSEYDMYVGMRCPEEYAASKKHFDYILWVDASGRGVPPEPRSSMGISYVPGEMIYIPNNGSVGDLEDLVVDWGRRTF